MTFWKDFKNPGSLQCYEAREHKEPLIISSQLWSKLQQTSLDKTANTWHSSLLQPDLTKYHSLVIAPQNYVATQYRIYPTFQIMMKKLIFCSQFTGFSQKQESLSGK